MGVHIASLIKTGKHLKIKKLSVCIRVNQWFNFRI